MSLRNDDELTHCFFCRRYRRNIGMRHCQKLLPITAVYMVKIVYGCEYRVLYCTSMKLGILFCMDKWLDGCCWRPPKRRYRICCCSLTVTISCSSFHGQHALVSCEPSEYACVEQNAKNICKKKQQHRFLRACIELLCTWHRIECTVNLFATQRLSTTYTLELSGSPGPAQLHTRLGRRAQIDQRQC